jgi:hypothetical protein
MDEVEASLFSADEAFVYNVAMLDDLSQRRAQTWKLESPAMVLALNVVSRGNSLSVQLRQRDEARALVAICVMDEAEVEEHPLDHWVDPVIDSSRYFRLRIRRAAGGTTMLGVGFRERNAAFLFRETLSEHYNRAKRLRSIVPPSSTAPAEEEFVTSDEFSLKEGATLKLQVSSLAHPPRVKPSHSPGLAAPRSAAAVAEPVTTTTTTTTTIPTTVQEVLPTNDDDGDDFGAFA